jgi:hypothetical protein
MSYYNISNMSLLDDIRKSFGVREKSEYEKHVDEIKRIQIKRAEAQLRLARERTSSSPNESKIAAYESEVRNRDEELKRFEESLPPDERAKRLDRKIEMGQRALEMEKSKEQPDMRLIGFYEQTLNRLVDERKKITQ